MLIRTTNQKTRQKKKWKRILKKQQKKIVWRSLSTWTKQLLQYPFEHFYTIPASSQSKSFAVELLDPRPIISTICSSIFNTNTFSTLTLIRYNLVWLVYMFIVLPLSGQVRWRRSQGGFVLLRGLDSKLLISVWSFSTRRRPYSHKTTHLNRFFGDKHRCICRKSNVSDSRLFQNLVGVSWRTRPLSNQTPCPLVTELLSCSLLSFGPMNPQLHLILPLSVLDIVSIPVVKTKTHNHELKVLFSSLWFRTL